MKQLFLVWMFVSKVNTQKRLIPTNHEAGSSNLSERTISSNCIVNTDSTVWRTKQIEAPPVGAFVILGHSTLKLANPGEYLKEIDKSKKRGGPLSVDPNLGWPKCSYHIELASSIPETSGQRRDQWFNTDDEASIPTAWNSFIAFRCWPCAIAQSANQQKRPNHPTDSTALLLWYR